MHNLFLGDIKRHIEDIFKTDVTADNKQDEPSRSPESLKKRRGNEPHDTAQQREALTAAVDALKRRHKSDLSKVRVGYLRSIAIRNGVPIVSGVDKALKPELLDGLVNWVRQNPDTPIYVPEPLEFAVIDFHFKTTGKDAILDGPLLKDLWNTTAQAILPSWMTRGPPRIGAPGQGRVGADEWRTVGLILLPVVLIRTWGTLPSDTIEYKLLANFMALVIAIEHASRNTMSENIRLVVQEHYHFYCKTLVELYGEGVLTPNHHFTFHLVEFLKLFGPIRGWWAFPFERYNGIIQRFNTNGHFGELCDRVRI
ncbi:hypothetical protein OF83DRAFT_1071007 [Amylostereum chailletii]|nr:hypothetical protein OF83DRAFT_1071007 [Amylostereum chailletii]